MEKTVKKLLTIIKKNYNGYPNEKLIIKFLSNIIYLIEDTELSDEKKIREIKYNINNLFPPREGLTEYYIFLENRKEMIIVNQEIKELRENLYSLYRKIQKKNYMQLKYPQEQLYMKVQLHHKVGCIWEEWKPNKYLYKSLGKYQELKS